MRRRSDRISRQIAAMHESADGRYCCKSRKSKNSENLAKVGSSVFSLLQRPVGSMRRPVVVFCETMWSLTSRRGERTGGPEKFRRSGKKDLFKTICTKPNLKRRLTM